MNYPRIPDEFTDAELAHEIERRINARAAGVCPYCGYSLNREICNQPDQHVDRKPPSIPVWVVHRDVPYELGHLIGIRRTESAAKMLRDAERLNHPFDDDEDWSVYEESVE